MKNGPPHSAVIAPTGISAGAIATRAIKSARTMNAAPPISGHQQQEPMIRAEDTNVYIFTHDSIGVGEDGPTHEPVETVSSVRIMPQIDVIRPADPEETTGAFVAAMQRTNGPTLLALTRQVVPLLNDIDLVARRQGVARGGYIAKNEKGKLDLIIMSCGSELQHALAAAKELGDGVRVVSMPCFERFNRQSAEYREEVLPNACRKRVAIEAGVPDTWYQFVGLDGKIIGLHEFGLSAPGAEVMKERGIDAKHVIDAARSLG